MAESKVKRENYRLKYKQYFGIDFDDTYDIHHIDGDHSNNDINNLLLLPSKLHSKYHFQKQIIEAQPVPTKICGNGVNGQNYYLSCLESFLKTLQECNKWHDFKMYLSGAMPNIHGIKL